MERDGNNAGASRVPEKSVRAGAVVEKKAGAPECPNDNRGRTGRQGGIG